MFLCSLINDVLYSEQFRRALEIVDFRFKHLAYYNLPAIKSIPMSVI